MLRGSGFAPKKGQEEAKAHCSLEWIILEFLLRRMSSRVFPHAATLHG
jgi:hypothetical protein